MSQPLLISVRAIEDIIQIQKVGENSASLRNLPQDDKVDDVLYSVSRLDAGCAFADKNVWGLPQDYGFNSVTCNFEDAKRRKRQDGNGGSEGDFSRENFLTGNVTSVVENPKFAGESFSETELKSWPSDSDVTVLRMKSDFRDELSPKVEWEEERSLRDASSLNLDWESDSLINLADVVSNKEKDETEVLTAFAIWSNEANRGSKAAVESTRDSTPFAIVTNENDSEVSTKNVNSVDEKSENSNTESVELLKSARTLKSNSNRSRDGTKSRKLKRIGGFFQSLLRCRSKKKTFEGSKNSNR